MVVNGDNGRGGEDDDGVIMMVVGDDGVDNYW